MPGFLEGLLSEFLKTIGENYPYSRLTNSNYGDVCLSEWCFVLM